METYLLKFSACLGVFWLVYVLFLERQNMHRFKRFYLLGVLILALVIPTLTITEYVEPVVTTFETTPIFLPMELAIEDATIEEVPFFNLETVLWLIYGLGALVFASRFIINLITMKRRISKNDNINKRSFIYVLLHENIIPHSFFRYIFFNKTRYESNNIPKEVLLHEETHAKQLHSLDIIILELLQIAFWFHPLIYILKHHVKLNHEFLADQAVLKQGVNTKTYQNILLQFSSSDSYRNTQDYQFSSAINYSSIKKRFTVMKTQTSKTRVWLSTLLVLPMIAILFYSFAEKEYVEKDNIETSELLLVQNDSQSEEATEKLMQEYRDFITRYNDTNVIIGKKYERAIIIYDQLMSENQRSSVEKYPARLIPEPNLSKTTPRKLSSEQLEAFKDTKEYAIWIDGNHISNSELSNYTVDDIVHFTGSKVHNNARSKKFPQPFQFSLYTKNGFKTSYQESAINSYHKISKTYSEAIGAYLKGPQTDNSELKILKAQADKLYNQFTKEELEKHNILMAPPVPAQYTNSNHQVKPIMVILINRNGQILVDDELGSIKSIESTLKKLSESFDKSSAVYVKYDGTEDSYKTIKEVKSLIRTYNFKIIQADTSQIAPPPPPAKQKTNKGGPNPDNSQKTHNPSFLEYIVEMENEGASFYLDDKKISSQEAKSLAANNKAKSTEMLTQLDGNGKYVVKLSNRKNNVSSDDEIYESTGTQDIPTAKEVAEYNAWAKQLKKETLAAQENENNGKTANYPIVKQKDLIKYVAIYNRMTPKQKQNSVELPIADDELKATGLKFPPPPPPAIQTGKVSDSQIDAYNNWIKNLKDPNSKHRMVEKEHFEYFMSIYNLMTEEQQKESEGFPPPPPPPAQISQQSKVKVVRGYGNITTSDSLIEENRYPTPEARAKALEPITVEGKPSQSTKKESIIPMVNGKTLESSKFSMSSSEFKKLKLSLPNNKIKSFSLKIPGEKTQMIVGNEINKQAITLFNTRVNKDSIITIFNIKDDKDSNIAPLVIEITD